MKKLLPLSCAAMLLSGVAGHAVTLDLTDGLFTPGAPSIIPGDPVSFTDTAGGVTFTFTAVDNFVGVTRFLAGAGDAFPDGIRLGGGGGTTTVFDFTVDTDIELTGLSGFNQMFLTAPTLSLTQGATILDDTIGFSGTGSDASAATAGTFAGGATFLIEAGLTYTFDVLNDSAVTSGALTGLAFDLLPAGPGPAPTPAPVPLPAGAPLLLAGLGALAWLRRRPAS